MNKHWLSPIGSVGFYCFLLSLLSLGAIVPRVESKELSADQSDEAPASFVAATVATPIEQAAISTPVEQTQASATPQLLAETPTTSPTILSRERSVSELSTPIPEPVSQPAGDAMGQVTSVSQLSDVQPTDWAFQALQSLVERYGCIAGYPDRTYRGNRALTRFEFAAGLNACLDRVSELIAAGTADLVTKQDLATLQRLQEEFAAELATLRGRVDALEARTATLEAQQFSTTTKLTGEAIFSINTAWGPYPGAGRANAGPGTSNSAVNGVAPGTPGQDTQTTFSNRVRLNLLTSFSGKDLLITGLQVFNFGGGVGAPFGSTSGVLGYGDPVFGTASNVRLSYEPQFGSTNPSTLVNTGANAVSLYKLLYIFPVADRITLFAGTNAEVSDAFPTITPFASEGQGAISRFAGLNPALRVSGGTSGIGLAAAAGFIWNISDGIDLRALYGSVNAAVPTNLGFPGSPLGSGLFNGSYIAATQLTLKPTDTIDLALNYSYSYHQLNILATGLSASDIGSITSANPAIGVTTPVRLNTVGATLAWRLTPQITFSTYGSYIFVDTASGVGASTTFNSWMAGLAFYDLLGKGNQAGLIFGQPLAKAGLGGAANRSDNTTPYHLEGYLNFRLNDNISVTPGVFFVFNPEGFSGNPTATVGVLRTTFTF